MNRPRKYDHDAILEDWRQGLTTRAIVERHHLAGEHALRTILNRRRQAGDPRAIHRISVRPINTEARCIAVTVPLTAFDAIEAAATARGETVTGLCRRIITTVATDGMVDAVLDDRS